MEAGRRSRLSEEAVRRFAAAVRSAQLYASGHPLVQRSLDALGETITQLVADQPSIAIGLIEQEIVVGDTPLPKGAEQYGEFIRRLQGVGIERIAFERGVTAEALRTLIATLAHPERATSSGRPGVQPADPLGLLQSLPHIKVGRISLDDRVSTSAADVATIRRLYSDAVNLAGTLWEGTQQDGDLDPQKAQQLVDNLAQAVAQNRTALVALTALKEYDNYTFTHMVNVSILTMAQARALGIEGALLREFGLAALMHDIGKVRTPVEILNKPDRLTDQEFDIMRRHVVDGAEILRRTPEMPPLAAVVAFEHHLRLDGTGYPFGVTRNALNVGTMLCSIADVYDAMRSQRAYQQSFPSERILAVLKRNDGIQFDQHLVRRFSQLMGIYPPGNLVRLDTGELGVVLRVYAPDPYRPKVRVIVGAEAEKLQRPYDVNLWETTGETGGPQTVVSPVDPAVAGIDPLTYL
ncbi:MAG TPA: HD-GYP domain-containing protein [Vicinamibacterales bacterium]|nr:HD-GYP domain-containing protein [Vicinamibacterales bacterium]